MSTSKPTGNSARTPANVSAVGVIGTGYVGLVVGVCLAQAGHHVTCIDISEERVATLRQGWVPYYEPGLDQLLRDAIGLGRLQFSTDLGLAARSAEVLFLTVGTPSNVDGSPDLSAVFAAAEDLARSVTGPRTLVLKSTVPVGTTARVQALVDRVAVHPIRVLMNPEFLREGSAIQDFLQPARIAIGARDPRDAEGLVALYRSLIPEAPLFVVDPESAELAKYVANAFLATKVSFINDVADLCERVGADVDLVRHIAGLDPRVGTSYMAPGLGYGGSCLPKDLRALEFTAREHQVQLRVLPSVREVNDSRPARFADRIAAHFGGSLAGRRLAVWGLAFKPMTDDIRESPALALVRLLVERGASVQVFDPQAMGPSRSCLGDTVVYGRDMYDVLPGADALIIATEWPEFRSADLERVKRELAAPVVFDTRNAIDPAAAEAAGLTSYRVGHTGNRRQNSPVVARHLSLEGIVR